MYYVLLAFLLLAPLAPAEEPPKSWIDPDTGHRIVRLTDEPGSASLYFNQNGYTAGGKKLIYTTPEGVSTFDFKTHESKLLVRGRLRVVEAGHKTPNVYFTRDGSLWSANTETGAVREIGKLPPRGGITTINADETLAAGTYVEGAGPDYNAAARPAEGPQGLDQPVNKGQMMEQRLAAHLPMGLYTINIQTGEVKTIHRATDWLNHLLFSPTDPTLLMFCHEGPWHKVERIWTIRTDGSGIRKVHTRTMAMEIFGHEFWSLDGKTIYYDLQIPRGEDFWLAALNVDTGARTWYHLTRDEWSIHFNVNRGGTLYCGDGGDKGQVARATGGRWIYLFRPEIIENQGIQDPALVQPGVLRSEKLVNMSKHNYKLEPNVSFSPDGEWVVFRSNMLGATYAFAVEVKKASGSAPGSTLP